MIPWKLAEAAFGKLWLLAIPVIVAPIITIVQLRDEPAYLSTATVWVSRPENVDPGVLLRTALPWETPAQAQAQVIRDLLATNTFREAVSVEAGIEGDGAALRVARQVGVGVAGTNLLTISATTTNAGEAPKLVGAVLAVYQARASETTQRLAELQKEYLETELGVASAELERRRSELTDYLAENPGASDPERVDKRFEGLASSVDSQQLVVDGVIAALLRAEAEATAAPVALEATFSVQDNPSPPQLIGKKLTERMMYPVLATLFGAAVSATFLYATYRLDHAIRTSHDLVDLPVPVLGFVPDIKGGKPQFLSHRPFKWFAVGNKRDYARWVAASISAGGSEGYR